MKKTPTTSKKSPRQPNASPPTFSALMAEIQGCRRDLVTLFRLIVDSQKQQRQSLRQQLATLTKSNAQPGFLSSNVLPTSFHDAIFEAEREMAGR